MSTSTKEAAVPTSVPRTLGRLLLGGFLLFAGIGHMTFEREEFQAQVPRWVPLDPDFVVLASGVVEMALGGGLLVAGRRLRPLAGLIIAVFFIAVFPGNIAQWTEGKSAFNLDTDKRRFIRLFFQPVLVLWALWSTGGWRWLRRKN